MFTEWCKADSCYVVCHYAGSPYALNTELYTRYSVCLLGCVARLGVVRLIVVALLPSTTFFRKSISFQSQRKIRGEATMIEFILGRNLQFLGSKFATFGSKFATFGSKFAIFLVESCNFLGQNFGQIFFEQSV